MRNIRLNLLLIALTTVVMLAGCGSENRSGVTGVAGSGGYSTVGLFVCFNCHADNNNPGSFEIVFGDTQGDQADPKSGWLWGPHGNYHASDQTNKGYLNDGFPSYANFTDESCKGCHDPLGEGKKFQDYFILSLGAVDRPVIGCENCHGGGGSHYGTGPVAIAKPGVKECGKCHNASFPHSSSKPEGDKILENYTASLHGHSIVSSNYVTGSSTDVKNRCSRCHTDEGMRKYSQIVNGTEPYSTLSSTLNLMSNIAGASVIQCKTCHDGHNPKKLIGDKITGLPATWSSQFKTCTACHQLLKADGSVQNAAYHDPVVNSYGNVDEVITDTHYATSGNWSGGANINNITGYAFAYNGTNACADCHNPHDTNVTVNKQWAESRHANKTAGGAWAHYNWSNANRAACQRCHTTTGVVAFIAWKQTGGTVGNFTAPLSPNASWKPEMLKCNGCHINNKGSVRNPGAVISDYATVNIANQTQFPYIAASNVCLMCHIGRESGETIKADTSNYSNRSFHNSHYLTAGGTLFTTTGYEFANLTYTSPSFYKHDKIGNAIDAPNTGTNGPCVGCHMSTANNKHGFQPIAETAGVITAITSPVCNVCHPGGYALALTPASLETEKEHFAHSLEALDHELQNKGFFFAPNNPYIFNGPYNSSYTETGSCSQNLAKYNWQTDGTTNYSWNGTNCTTLATASVNGISGTGKNNMGAAFNMNLLEHDPGAFAHNRYYARRLIYDAIDWIDDNSINDSVKVSLANATHAGQIWQADAQSYILNGGVSCVGANCRF